MVLFGNKKHSLIKLSALNGLSDEFNKLSADNKKLTLRLLAGSGCDSILD